LTKGDDNVIDDRGLYSPGQLWLEKKDIIGKVKGYPNFLFALWLTLAITI
jgi:hypothetical protein